MKKCVFFTILLCLLAFYQYTHGQEAYGWNLYDSNSPEDVGPCKFDVTNPTKFTLLRKHDFGICAGAFVGKKYYVYTYRSTGNASEPLAFGIYDFVSGGFTQIADYSAMKTLFYDMSYDYKNSIMYALGRNGNVSTLLKVDLTNGNVTEIVKLSQQFVALAVSIDGIIVAEDLYGYLTQIDLNGNETPLNSCDYTPETQIQSMAINHTNEQLYWVIPTAREGTQILTINQYGFSDNNTELIGEKQIVGFDFPYSTVKDGAPSIPEGLRVETTSPGSKEVTVSFTAPKHTVGGGILNSLDIHILRGSIEVFTKNKLAPGENVTFTETLPQNALYTYKVYASNNVGVGEEVVAQIYAGEDIPDVVTDIQIKSNPSGKQCLISWKAPRKGLEGGYIPRNLTYDVLRFPDNVIVAKATDKTSITDADIPRLDNYCYEITPIGRERGKSILTESIVLGKAHTVPFTCKFTDADMPLWTIIDNNNDKVTWKRTMVNEGVTCSYSSQQSDDWLISKPIALKAKTKYKVKVTASAYDHENVEKMNFCLGKGTKPENISKYKVIGSHIVENDEGEKGYYVSYFTSDINEDINFAIQKISDPDKFQLVVYSVVIKEASEGILQGRVTFDNRPIEGVKIIIKGTNFITKTNENGEWKFTHVPEARYTIEARKEGFALYSKEVEIASEKTNIFNFELVKIQKQNVSGLVTYNGGIALGNARVSFKAIDASSPTDQIVVYTDNNGVYKLQVYEGLYRRIVMHNGLHHDSTEVIITKNQNKLPPVILRDKAVIPRLVNVKTDANTSSQITWDEPIDVDSMTYYKGPGVARIGVFSYTERSIVGTVFRKDMAITKVYWQTDTHRGPHNYVDLVIFALDANGNPTRNIIYEKKDIENNDNKWCSYELEQPLVVLGGALVAFRYNGYLSMLADAGVNGGMYFEKCVHVINSDYETSEFEYLDKHNLEKNLLIGIDYVTLDDKTKDYGVTLQRQNKYRIYRKEEGANKSWEKIASVQASKRNYTDSEYSTLPMGYYRYAVTSVVSEKEESIKAVSNLVGKNVCANVTFVIKANASLPNTEPVIKLISESDKRTEFLSVRIDESRWEIKDIPKGKYTLYATLDGFEEVIQPTCYDGEDTAFVTEVNFTERILPPYNVKVEKTQNDNDRLLTWNTDNYVFDDFESYKPFTIEPASENKNWVYWDRDKDATVEFDGLTFEHMGEPMSFIVFNPYATNPALAFFDNASLPYSGEQYLSSFGNRNKSNRDYIFSPIFNYTAPATFSCMIRSFSNQLGSSCVKVGYTEVDYPKTDEDIYWLSQSLNISDKIWQKLEINVPSNAKRMVLLNETPKGYFLLIDNLFIGEENPYADETIKKPKKDRATYEVKLDGKIVNEIDQLKRTALLPSLKKGTHTVQVTAMYQSGHSESKDVTFEVLNDSSLVDIYKEDAMSVSPNPVSDILYISDNVENWALFDFDGRLIYKGKCNILNVQKLPPGVYFIRLSNTVNNVVKKLIKQ